MAPLVKPLVPMVMSMVPLALQMVSLVPLVSQWYHGLPMVPLVQLPMVPLGNPEQSQCKRIFKNRLKKDAGKGKLQNRSF